jgi:hypothetical protein
MTTCGGDAGIWAYSSNDVTIQYNEAYDIEPSAYTSGCDWDGFDLDGYVTNSTLQYNYSHDNFGGGFITYIATPWGPNTIRDNIAQNNATSTHAANFFGDFAITNYSGSMSGLNFYNNTAFSDGPSGTDVFSIAGNPATTTIANNIFYSSNGADLVYTEDASTSGIVLANNDYFATGPFKIGWLGTTYTTLASYQAASGQDASSTSTNPLLVNAGSGGTCGGWSSSCPSSYELQHGSPMTGLGLNLNTAFGINPGTQDYFGDTIPNLVGTGINIGADSVAR